MVEIYSYGIFIGYMYIQKQKPNIDLGLHYSKPANNTRLLLKIAS